MLSSTILKSQNLSVSISLSSSRAYTAYRAMNQPEKVYLSNFKVRPSLAELQFCPRDCPITSLHGIWEHQATGIRPQGVLWPTYGASGLELAALLNRTWDEVTNLCQVGPLIKNPYFCRNDRSHFLAYYVIFT